MYIGPVMPNLAAINPLQKIPADHELGLNEEILSKMNIKPKYSFTMPNGVEVLWLVLKPYDAIAERRQFTVRYKKELVILRRGKDFIATADFSIYKNSSKHYISLFDFADACDEYSQETSDFGGLVATAYPTVSRALINPNEEVVELTMLVVSEGYKGTLLWVDAINAFIDKRFKPIDFEFMLLHAAPTQYVNPPSGIDAQSRRNYTNRQRAMFRFYKKTLKAYRIGKTEYMLRDLQPLDQQ